MLYLIWREVTADLLRRLVNELTVTRNDFRVAGTGKMRQQIA